VRPSTEGIPPAQKDRARRGTATLAALPLALVLVACAARPGAPASAGAPAVAAAAASNAADDVQCTTERPTGSMLPVRVCTTKAQRTAIDRSTRDTTGAIQRLPGRACPGTPGCPTT
jgi:hypothetical protein